MRHTVIIFVTAFAGAAACADEPALSVTLNTEQAQARQFGIHFGGTATEHDLCVRKGFLAKGDQNAEAIAKAVIEQMRELKKGPDQSAYMQEGWDSIKKEIAEHESFLTQERCAGVGKEWDRMMASMRKK